MGDGSILSALDEDYKQNIPDDINDSKSFEWFIEEAIDDPYISRSAYQRVSDMFEFYGKDEEMINGRDIYKMVSEDPLDEGKNVFYGDEFHTFVNKYVDILNNGAQDMELKKKLILMAGPVGAAKSHFDRRVREYFEDYTRREEGKMYTFKWKNLTELNTRHKKIQDPREDEVRSPMNQDPLVLLPKGEMKKDIMRQMNDNLDEQYSIKMEQNPDPVSAFYMEKLLEKYDDDISKVLKNHIEIERLVADENRKQAIATFVPQDPKNQDESELTGEFMVSKKEFYGPGDPRAFSYSGAFCNANRGIFSGEELLKLQTEFLYDFLHATEERWIQPRGNNPKVDIDSVIVGRTNMPELKEKADDEKMEAFNSRTLRIDVPYILEYEEESKIYKRSIENSDNDTHIEPHTMEMAGLFAVMSRLEDPDFPDDSSLSDIDISLLEKAKLYNGDELDISGKYDIKKIQDESNEKADLLEGMSGISPRFINEAINYSIMSNNRKGKDFVWPLNVFKHIEQEMPKKGTIKDQDIDNYLDNLEAVKEEYTQRAQNDVRRAIAYDEEEIREMGNKYLDEVAAYIDDTTLKDEFTEQNREPDKKFMRDVEKKIGIRKDMKDSFRRQISNWIARRARKGHTLDPTENENLRKAIEMKSWEDKKQNINLSALVKKADDELEDSEWIENLKNIGYSEGGAREVLNYAGAKIAKEEME